MKKKAFRNVYKENNVELNKDQIEYLLVLCKADLKRMNDLADHAVAHNTDVYLPYHATCGQCTDALMNEWKTLE